MPGNFLHLGLIAVLFPQARIIHCRRDPMDVCVSCYTQNFRSLVYATDLTDLAEFYRQYDRLMTHWRDVLPLEVKDVQYEQLVQSPEQDSRALIDFCGLPWSQRVLEFHTARSSLQTASKLQVRKPIYQTSVGRWHRFRYQLAALISDLS